jgi:hypothetical protein
MTSFNSNTFVPQPMGTWVETEPEEMPKMVFTLMFSVPKRDVGFILGSKAFKIKNINLKSGAHADLKQPITPDGLPFFLIQSIDPRAVQMCYAMIQQEAVKAEALNTGKMSRYIKSEPKSSKTKNEVVSKKIQFNESDAGLIIGKGGSNLRTLRDEFNLHYTQVSDGILTISGNAGTADLDGAEKYLKQTFPNCFEHEHVEDEHVDGDDETMTIDEYRHKKSMEWPKVFTPSPPPSSPNPDFPNHSQIQKKSEKDTDSAYKF